MRRILLLFFSFFSLVNIYSQSGDTITSQLAKVNVYVTDMKGKPSKGETVLFRSEKTKQTLGGRSDAAGKFSLELAPGDTYMITVKSLTDTTKYGKIEIPALGPDEFFTDPFKVNVKFEAAKKYTLDNVHFDFGKATLRPESFPELEELAAYLKNKET
ncbi:MAG: hypothetical protein JNJ86_10415, partial [Chitinophagaceae bacterium]|nr:hypothetical protein [Chitinophagaceae bacterium]